MEPTTPTPERIALGLTELAAYSDNDEKTLRNRIKTRTLAYFSIRNRKLIAVGDWDILLPVGDPSRKFRPESENGRVLLGSIFPDRDTIGTVELAAALGVSRATLARAAIDGEFPATKHGKKDWRIDREALIAWLREIRVPTRWESEAGS